LGGSEIIDTDIASCLYCGMMTDTGCFSFNSSQPETFLILANLLKSGIDKDTIFSNVYENYSLDRTNLLGYCLNEKMIVKEEYHTAIIALNQKELKQFNHQPGDTEGFVNLPFSIKNIVFTVFMMEKKDHIKMSFRSKNSFEVNTFSEKHFNGGGHKNAAGGKSFASLDETIKKLENLLPQYNDELRNAILP
jgi:phosphoesterase RecJ-like protein